MFYTLKSTGQNQINWAGISCVNIYFTPFLIASLLKKCYNSRIIVLDNDVGRDFLVTSKISAGVFRVFNK